MSPSQAETLLAPYRVLDLTDETGVFCGKLLGDLGADVIKVERPGGDPARQAGPFHGDEPHPDKSLFWLSLNTSKRGITLDVTRPEGLALFRRLAAAADVVLESSAPGRLEGLGLGYEALRAINPRLIYTSITAFGQSGPYRDLLATDLTLWALSGLLYICGDTDRPPLRISLPQAWLHAASDGATGTALALFHRNRTGIGQRVDVSALKSMERVGYIARNIWLARGRVLRRPGSALKVPPLGTTTPLIWSCQDGYVAFYLFGGAMGAVSNPALTQWMAEEGLATETMLGMDWPKFNIGKTPQDEIDREIVGPIRQFFRSHTRAELWAGGVRRRVMVYPVNDAAGVRADAQLAERGFWQKLEHEDLGATWTYPGAFVKTAGDLCRVRRRAPRVGEHNQAIYGHELGLSAGEVSALAAAGVI